MRKRRRKRRKEGKEKGGNKFIRMKNILCAAVIVTMMASMGPFLYIIPE